MRCGLLARSAFPAGRGFHALAARPQAQRGFPALAARPHRSPVRGPAQALWSAAGDSNSSNEAPHSRTRWVQYLAQMAVSGAALGPLLDGYHSAFGVLKYTQPKQVMLGSVFVCETDFWVPPMFALAAIILGVAYPLLDAKLELKEQKRRPSGSAILTCISFFCLQYYTSGLLTSVGVGGAPLHTVLAVTAAACWYVWDRTPTGTIMCVVTGLAGPAVEVGLLQGYPAIFGSELYHYSNPDVLGIPLWISWVYACGAPAVGGLARGLWNSSSQAPHS